MRGAVMTKKKEKVFQPTNFFIKIKKREVLSSEENYLTTKPQRVCKSNGQNPR